MIAKTTAVLKKSRKTKNDAIPLNRAATMDLPPAVRDLADLLADIAVTRLNALTPSGSAGLEKTRD